MKRKDYNVTALKDCDIRGTYSDEVYEELIEGAALGFGKKIFSGYDANNGEKPLVVLAGDGRVSTPSLKISAMKGLKTSALRILDAGIVPTNIAYWIKEKKKAQAITIITASHNPPNYNGMKLMNGEYPPSPEEIYSLADYIGESTSNNEDAEVEYWPESVLEYQKELVGKFRGKLQGLKVVVDPGNGCLSGIASDVYRKLGAEVVVINDFRDGNFPGRLPDCAIPANLTGLCKAVLDNKADFGVAFDGDGDRIAIVDNCGRFVRTEHVAMILLRERLKDMPGQNVIIDVKCSSKLENLIINMGCNPQRCKSGHGFMKKMVIKTEANMGVELSGHIFIKELSGRDDPLYSSLIFAGIVNKLENSLEQEVEILPSMYTTEDIRVKLNKERIDEIINLSKTSFEDAHIDSIDGTRVVFENGWILARKSITEPKITVRLEGNTPSDLEAIAQKFNLVFDDMENYVIKAVSEASQ